MTIGTATESDNASGSPCHLHTISGRDAQIRNGLSEFLPLRTASRGLASPGRVGQQVPKRTRRFEHGRGRATVGHGCFALWEASVTPDQPRPCPSPSRSLCACAPAASAAASMAASCFLLLATPVVLLPHRRQPLVRSVVSLFACASVSTVRAYQGQSPTSLSSLPYSTVRTSTVLVPSLLRATLPSYSTVLSMQSKLCRSPIHPTAHFHTQTYTVPRLPLCFFSLPPSPPSGHCTRPPLIPIPGRRSAARSATSCGRSDSVAAGSSLFPPCVLFRMVLYCTLRTGREHDSTPYPYRLVCRSLPGLLVVNLS